MSSVKKQKMQKQLRQLIIEKFGKENRSVADSVDDHWSRMDYFVHMKKRKQPRNTDPKKRPRSDSRRSKVSRSSSARKS